MDFARRVLMTRMSSIGCGRARIHAIPFAITREKQEVSFARSTVKTHRLRILDLPWNALATVRERTRAFFILLPSIKSNLYVESQLKLSKIPVQMIFSSEIIFFLK